MGMPQWTLCVRLGRDAERPGLHSHAERGNDQRSASDQNGLKKKAPEKAPFVVSGLTEPSPNPLSTQHRP
ncbi:hypothetical protein FQ192_14340 [Pseudomonas sp. ANT_J12]|nr:hypothetical protein FQ192_14340 [Pseudomonas sp. ANT_J12]